VTYTSMLPFNLNSEKTQKRNEAAAAKKARDAAAAKKVAQWKSKDAPEDDSDDDSEIVDSIPEKKRGKGFMSRLKAQDGRGMLYPLSAVCTSCTRFSW
jgi:hypothetical protein